MDKLNNDGDSTNAILCDEGGTIMAASQTELIGRDVTSLHDDRLRDLASSASATTRARVEQIREGIHDRRTEVPAGHDRRRAGAHRR